MSYERTTRRQKQRLPLRIQAEIARKPKAEAGMVSTGARESVSSRARREELPELKGDLTLTLGLMAVLITAVVVASLVPEVRDALQKASEVVLKTLVRS